MHGMRKLDFNDNLQDFLPHFMHHFWATLSSSPYDHYLQNLKSYYGTATIYQKSISTQNLINNSNSQKLNPLVMKFNQLRKPGEVLLIALVI